MRHFDFLDSRDHEHLFHRVPAAFDTGSPPATLAMGLGATLYSPATRPTLASDILQSAALGVMSCVICLEDAIPEAAVEGALEHTVAELALLSEKSEVPLVFVRVRRPEQILRIATALGPESGRALFGFVLPKFSAERGAEYLDATRQASRRLGRTLWAMPVIETARVMHHETRGEELLGVRALLLEHRDQVLAVRIGATDLASVYALRRPRDLTIYDIRLVSDAMCQIINVLGRAGSDGFAITGPVWEYFTRSERIFKPQLRESPFAHHEDPTLRARLVARDLDGLIREVVLDRANGLVGKTVIHPSHVPVVHALSVVSHEEYVDASEIAAAAGAGGGVSRSAYGNKMNESNPHLAWAERTLLRAEVFGVAAEDTSFVDLLAACVRI